MPSRRTATPPQVGDDRREAVLESAMQTFSKFGYRKTSMDDIATAARISRPGLYFLFESKPVLFREAVARSLDRDLDIIARTLGDGSRTLHDRVIAAFDQWAGSYIGPLTGETSHVHDFDPELLGSLLDTAPRRFEELVAATVRAAAPADADDRTRTLISASIGIKHQVETRESYIDRLTIAVSLLLS